MKPYAIIILNEGHEVNDEQMALLKDHYGGYYEIITQHEPPDGWTPGELKDFIDQFRWPDVIMVEGASSMVTLRQLAFAEGSHEMAEYYDEYASWEPKVRRTLILHQDLEGKWRLS